MSASSVGSRRSSASSSSTSLPSRANAEAISAPDAPAPTTARRAGTSGSAHASSVPITRPPNSTPGIGRGIEPVARIDAARGDFHRLGVERVDQHVAVGRQRARSPSITSMPSFLNSPPTPEVSVETTFSRRACTAG